MSDTGHRVCRAGRFCCAASFYLLSSSRHRTRAKPPVATKPRLHRYFLVSPRYCLWARALDALSGRVCRSKCRL